MINRCLASFLVVLITLPVANAAAQSRAQFHAGDRAETLFKDGDLTKAARAFETLARADSSNSYAWYRAGMAYRGAGDLDRAVDMLSRAATFPAYELSALLERARAETALGDHHRALATLEDLIDRGYDRPERLLSDADLAPLRRDDRFRALHRQMLESPRRLNARHSSWAPSGEWIVFEGLLPETGNYDLHLIRPDGSERRRLTGTADHDHDPDWSPSGDRIVFVRVHQFSGKKSLWTITVDGDEARNVSGWFDEQIGMPQWSPDGRRLIYSRWRGDEAQLWTLDATTGESQPLLLNDQDKGNPVFAPDGRGVYYDARGEDDSWAIYRHDLDSGERTTFLTGWWWWDVEFSPSGERLVAGRWEAGRGRFGRLGVIDAETREFELITPDEFDAWYPTWSPDGKWICFSRGKHPYGASGRSLWIIRADGTEMRPLFP